MNKTPYIWLDGALVPWEQATTHVTTHTLHYGSGAFEGIRCYKTKQGPAIFRLQDHIERLCSSFAYFNRSLPWSHAELAQAVIDTVRANALSECYIRPILFFGGESLLLDLQPLSIHCAIISFPLDKYFASQAINVGITPWQRLSPHAVPINGKISGFYVNSIVALNEVKQRGFDEALMLDDQGYIAEGSIENVFFVIDNVLKTPPTRSIVPGITRSTIIALAHAHGIKVLEEPITVANIQRATEAFFTGTASEIMPIKKIEDTLFDKPSPVTQHLQQAYTATIHGENNMSWLTFI